MNHSNWCMLAEIKKKCLKFACKSVNLNIISQQISMYHEDKGLETGGY